MSRGAAAGRAVRTACPGSDRYLRGSVVFNEPMRSRTLACTLSAIAVLLALFAAPAGARIVELGKTAQEPTPSCPGKPCLAMSRTTGYQAKVGSERDMYVVPRAGKIVAWSVTLSDPTKKQVRFFDDTLGGPASAAITIIRPGDKLYGRVISQSPVERLAPYFGETVQFPLGRALNVRKGYIVALTVPTWAPALAVGFGNDTSWRASRTKEQCQNTAGQTAQTRLGAITRFTCLYRTARLTYSATLITNPRPAKKS